MDVCILSNVVNNCFGTCVTCVDPNLLVCFLFVSLFHYLHALGKMTSKPLLLIL